MKKKIRNNLSKRAAVSLFKEIAGERLNRIVRPSGASWGAANKMLAALDPGVQEEAERGSCRYTVDDETFTVGGVTEAECACLGGEFTPDPVDSDGEPAQPNRVNRSRAKA